MTETTAGRDEGTRKAVLFCPACGHESSVDGDWEIEEGEFEDHGRLVYVCPRCGETITSRPVFRAPTP